MPEIPLLDQDIAEALAQFREGEAVTMTVVDLNGVSRGKRIPASRVEAALRGEMRMPLSALCVDVWGVDVSDNGLVFETGDADGRLVPTGRGVLMSEWAESRTALLPAWMSNPDGSGFQGDPRRALAAVVDRYKALGLTPVVAMELEFYLVEDDGMFPKPPRPPGSARSLRFEDVYSIDELDAFGPFFDEVYEHCAALGVPADAALSENGCGQFEINLNHVADPLRAADDAMLFKRVVKGVARRHGFTASFMAKPYGERSGSGLHTHFSLIDADGRNLFNDGGPDGTDMMRAAVAGQLALMPETMLIFAPHLNSYRRLRPGTHAPTSALWGYENRTASIRIPDSAPQARRIEHRVAGADANPYLALAALLGAALIGIEREMTPPPPVEGDGYKVEGAALPLDWITAIRAFEKGEMIGDVFHPLLRRLLSTCKRQEYGVFSSRVTRFEHDTYLETI